MDQPPKPNTLLIDPRDASVVLYLRKGGYSIADGAICISVSTKLSAEDFENESIYTTCAFVCMESYPIHGSLRAGDVFAHCGGRAQDTEDQFPKAHGYFGFHAEQIAVKWAVLEIAERFGRFSLEAFLDDVDYYYYYDERAKLNPSRGIFDLALVQASELRIPG